MNTIDSSRNIIIIIIKTTLTATLLKLLQQISTALRPPADFNVVVDRGQYGNMVMLLLVSDQCTVYIFLQLLLL